MGKGDKKSKKGKIFMGSYGNSRRRKSAKRVAAVGSSTVTATATEAKPKAKRAPRKKAKAAEK